MNELIVICGPTASGKTSLAHSLAKKNNGEIINADSMQLYKSLLTITSSPPKKLKSELPYHLYNFLDINCDYSIVEYVNFATIKIKEISSRKKLPILVGGSGMYINFLIKGFSYMPNIEPEIRKKVRSLQESLSIQDFFNLVRQSDPEVARVLNPRDFQRLGRAYEVFLQSGNSILEYQKRNKIELLKGYRFKTIMLLPEIHFLYSLCNKRLEEMFENGAIEEVKMLLNTNYNKNALALKSIGVKEIICYLKEEMSRKEALELAKTKTRHYAKRQITWFKHQIKDKTILNFSSIQEYEQLLYMVSPPGFEPGTT